MGGVDIVYHDILTLRPFFQTIITRIEQEIQLISNYTLNIYGKEYQLIYVLSSGF